MKKTIIILVLALFFQVGICGASDFNLGFYDSGDYTRAKVDNDADFIVNYNNSVYTLAYLDECHAKGLKVMVQLPRSYVETGDLSSIVFFVKSLQINGEDHPAILAWYLYDEPDGHNISASICESIYDRIRAISALPVAVTFIHYPWHCKVQEYHKSFDIMLFDEYPYPIRVELDHMVFSDNSKILRRHLKILYSTYL